MTHGDIEIRSADDSSHSTLFMITPKVDSKRFCGSLIVAALTFGSCLGLFKMILKAESSESYLSSVPLVPDQLSLVVRKDA